MSAVGVGAVVRANYLPFARVLAASLRRRHPDVPFLVLLADEVAGRFDPAAEPFEVVELASLGLPGHRERVFRHDPTEVVLSAKVDVLEHLLGRFGAALMLDADTLVLRRIGGLLDHAARHAVTLLPHRLTPATPEEELQLLLAGNYNAGVVGVAGDAAGFLAWWRERLRDHARHAPEEGMHGDQRWLDLVPGLFEGVGVLRDPAYDVAYWNVDERPRRTCRLFHFSGWRPEGPWPVTRWRPELPLAAMGRYAPLFERYRGQVLAAGHVEAAGWEYVHGRFDDGVAIPPFARELYRELGDAARFGDPFGVHAGSFRRWLDEPAGDGPVTRFWHEIWLRRADLREAFPDPLGADGDALLRWAEHQGVAEHDADPRLVPGATAAAAAPVVHRGGR